jgi:cyclophilin family peptidyl-prolyl cis-trans isomerase
MPLAGQEAQVERSVRSVHGHLLIASAAQSVAERRRTGVGRVLDVLLDPGTAPGRVHARGTLGISTRGRDTGDAQLCVNLVDNPRLDLQYTVFGKVVKGREDVDRLLEGDRMERVEVVLRWHGRKVGTKGLVAVGVRDVCPASRTHHGAVPQSVHGRRRPLDVGLR